MWWGLWFGAETRGIKWLVDFIARKVQLVLFNHSNNSGVIYVKMNKSNIVQNHHRMWRLPLSSKFHWDSDSVPIAKAASKKIGALIGLWSFFLLRLLVVSISLLYDVAWKTVFMKTLHHCLNLVTLIFFCRYCSDRCSSTVSTSILEWEIHLPL